MKEDDANDNSEDLKETTEGENEDGEDTTDIMVVTPTRTETNPEGNPRGISTVDDKELDRRGPGAATAAELLRGEPGVFVQQTGRTGGAPIIRGMIGNYILPMYDGIRLTDGTIFGGPNGYFNGIDRYAVRRIEIVRGPSSVFYGSDALGGTLNMIPKRYDGFPKAFDIGFGVESRYRSVSNLFAERVEFMGGTDRFNFFVGGTFVNSGDTRGGGGLGRSFNTSFTEFNFDIRAAVKLAEGHVLEGAYLRTEQRNVYRYDQPWETPDGNAWWNAHKDLYLTGSGLRKRMRRRPQSITQIASLTYAAEDPTPFWSEVQAKFYWRGEYQVTERGSEQASTRMVSTSVDHRNVYGLSTQFAWQTIDKNKIVYGVDSRLDDVYAGRAFTIVYDRFNGEKISRTADAPEQPAARYLDIGVFLYDEFKPADTLTLSAGIRYNYTNLNSRPTPGTVPDGIAANDLKLDTDFTAFTYNVGVVWAVVDELTLVANVGAGFKAPSISDTLSSGPFTFGVSVPSPDLEPEESTTYELGVRTQFGGFHGEIIGYYTDLRNLIDSREGFFQGLDFYDLNGNGVKDNDEQVYIDGNVGRAYVYGVEAAADWQFYEDEELGVFSVYGNATYTRGYDLASDDNLRFIPPFNGVLGARWELETGNEYGRRFWAQVDVPWSFNKPKNRFNERDFSDLAQFPRNPGNLPGWAIVNLRSGVEITDYASLSLSITNLLNTEYQSFGSRLPGEGFSFDIGVKFEW